MKKKNKSSCVFIICFLVMLAMPLLNINRINGMMAESENRYLKKFPEIFDKNSGKLQKNIFKEMNLWLNDNIGFRDFYLKMNTKIEYNIFKTSPSKQVIIGDDGYKFYNNNNNIQIAYNEYPIKKEMLDQIKIEQELIKESLLKKGIEYVLVLTPSKVSIYPEKIKGAEFQVTETAIDILEKYLNENTDIKVINTKQALINAKNEGISIFNKNDTHWNQEGAFIAYEEVSRKLREWGLSEENSVDIKREKKPFEGEFSAMMGDKTLLPNETVVSIKIKNPKAKTVLNPELVSKINLLHKNDNHLPTGNVFYKNDQRKHGKLLIYGDSFFGGWNIPSLFAENVSEMNFIWSDSIKNGAVSELNPNVVIFERTERFINTLVKKVDPELLFGKVEGELNSKIYRDLPSSMKKGQKYNLKIKVKNISENSWSDRLNIKMCMWQDGVDNGYRIRLPEKHIIKPNEEYIFILENFKVPENVNGDIEFQMLKEGITYFGDKINIKISE